MPRLSYGRKRSNKKILLIVVAAILLVVVIVLIALIANKDKGEEPAPSDVTNAPVATTEAPVSTDAPVTELNENGNTVETRFNVPAGFTRVPVQVGSFAEYLRKYPLLTFGSSATLYNGDVNTSAPIVGVLDLDVKDKSGLQQSADVLIRMYAEYCYAKHDYASIKFTLLSKNNFVCSYADWINGNRIRIKEGSTNEIEWYQPSNADTGASEGTLRYFLQNVDIYANTSSLKASLKKSTTASLSIGDIFIATSAETGKTEGHAMIVMDVAVNAQTGEKVFLLAEGNTPATSPYIVLNPTNSDTAWCRLSASGTFTKNGVTYAVDSIRRFE